MLIDSDKKDVGGIKVKLNRSTTQSIYSIFYPIMRYYSSVIRSTLQRRQTPLIHSLLFAPSLFSSALHCRLCSATHSSFPFSQFSLSETFQFTSHQIHAFIPAFFFSFGYSMYVFFFVCIFSYPSI
jgi:hypothetical protein